MLVVVAGFGTGVVVCKGFVGTLFDVVVVVVEIGAALEVGALETATFGASVTEAFFFIATE